MDFIDPSILKDIRQQDMEKFLEIMEGYVKQLAFKNPRLWQQMARSDGVNMPHKLVKALTRLTWKSKHFAQIDDSACERFSDLLWSMVWELAEPYADMFQMGPVTEKDVLVGQSHDDRVKVIDADDVVNDALKKMMNTEKEEVEDDSG